MPVFWSRATENEMQSAPESINLSPTQVKDLVKASPGMWQETKDLFYSSGWSLDKDQDKGTKIYSKKHEKRTVFKLQGIVDGPLDYCLDDLDPNKNLHLIPTWNDTFKVVRCLQKLDESTIAMYSATHEFSALVSSRDNVNLRKYAKTDSGVHMFAYKTIEIPEVPPVKGVVRSENFHSCFVLWEKEDNAEMTNFAWMMNMDYKLPSLVPSSVFNEVCRWILSSTMKCMHKRADVLRANPPPRS